VTPRDPDPDLDPDPDPDLDLDRGARRCRRDAARRAATTERWISIGGVG